MKLQKISKLKGKIIFRLNLGGDYLIQSKTNVQKIHKDLPKLIEENLSDVEKNWPKDLPKGIIHADLFHDNIFLFKISSVVL